MKILLLLVSFTLINRALAIDPEINELLTTVKISKANEYQYKLCDLETETLTLQIIENNSTSVKNLTIELPKNFYELGEFCGRWVAGTKTNDLYGWRSPPLKISLEPNVSHSGKNLIFHSRSHGIVKSITFNGSKVTASFKIIR